MSIEWHQVGGLDVCALRQPDGQQLIITSILARTLGITDEVRRGLDTKARVICGFVRGWLDEGNRPCLVGMVSANDLERYVDILWANRIQISRAAENKVWRLRAALKKDRRNGRLAEPRKTAQVDFFRPRPAVCPNSGADPL